MSEEKRQRTKEAWKMNEKNNMALNTDMRIY